MVTREELATIALDFLKAIAEATKAKMGPQPKWVQRSEWMVRESSGGAHSQGFKRTVFDRDPVFWTVAEYLYSSKVSPEQHKLEEALRAAGVLTEEIPGSFYYHKLVNHWLELPHPFEFEEGDVAQILDEFTTAVFDGRIVLRAKSALDLRDISYLPVELEKGITIREITEDELYELGEKTTYPAVFLDKDYFLPPSRYILMPQETWKILDIELQYSNQGQNGLSLARNLNNTHEALILFMLLSASGALQIIHLGANVNYFREGLMPIYPAVQNFGRGWGKYTLSSESTQRLKDLWAGIRKIMASEKHYLKLPARRWLDGARRERADDAILDYAIGLEALLTERITDELSYRFALRGATILGWNGGDKSEVFKKLREFYNVRSRIVHGEQVNQDKINEAHSAGEDYLQQIWWWYFTQNLSLKDATRKIDDCIES